MEHNTDSYILNNKVNCWEYKKCGREPEGVNSVSQGVCPAAIHGHLDKTNNGTNGGRICWSIDGTRCSEETDGTFLDRFEHCQRCSFYLLVQKQETRHLVVVPQHVIAAQ